jgi:cytochrome c551
MFRYALFGLTLLFGACADGEGDPSTDDGTTPIETDTPSGIDGARVYADECSVCHGSDGSGLSGPDLNVVTPGLDEAMLEDVIINGIGSMPPISLFDDELDAVVSYILAEFG